MAFALQQHLATHCFHCWRIFGKGNFKVPIHPMFSPDLALCDFWVFGTLKWELYNRHFESDVKLVTAVNHFQVLLPLKFHKMIIAK